MPLDRLRAARVRRRYRAFRGRSVAFHRSIIEIAASETSGHPWVAVFPFDTLILNDQAKRLPR